MRKAIHSSGQQRHRRNNTTNGRHASINLEKDDDGRDDKVQKRRDQLKEERWFVGIMICLVVLILGFSIFLWHLWNKQHQQHTATEARITPKSNNMEPVLRGRTNKNKQAFEHPAFEWLETLEHNILHNVPSKSWLNPELLVSLGEYPNPLTDEPPNHEFKADFSSHGAFFRVARFKHDPMDWQLESEPIYKGFTDYMKWKYSYPKFEKSPPKQNGALDYPKLTPLKQLFENWPQDELDNPPSPITETLQHFDFTDPDQVAAALEFQKYKVPFKFTNVPELLAANIQWTDEYVASQFSKSNQHSVSGKCQESPNNFFAFFTPTAWNVQNMGLPPTRNNDWEFSTWAQHANFADKTRLDPDRSHFYWQAGVPKEERELPENKWSFISRDLPSFSSPNATLISPSPQDQKGMQCRFGERGVTTATHFDAGKNMVGMITGAKRYVLGPPNQCSKLGIVTTRGHALFRHSLLNFGHFRDMKNSEMSPLEKQWLERAGNSLAVETILKAGEVLHIPSHWFHYIISLQKSAQCNVRSGVDEKGDKQFGGALDVSKEYCDPITSRRLGNDDRDVV